ncbi:autotransporter domain-containing protein [Lysobacteraceae bacterium NML08-0793]|nr:autotransporter domain-containing protein [Xanthomonadaceae bacterium NML08-0793]
MGNRFNRNELSWAVVSALALGLGACSSGGGSSSVPPLQIGGGSGGGSTTPTPAPTPAPTTTPTTAPGPVNAQPAMDAHLKLIGADQAIAAGYKGNGVTIGIVDTGVRRDHPTLNGRVSKNLVYVDADKNDLTVDDKDGHGTTVAQLAAGRAYSEWPGGVAQNATIVSSRIINDKAPADDGSGRGNEVHANTGIGEFFAKVNRDLADAGARIINNSWGGLYWNDDSAVTAEFVAGYSDFILNRNGLVVFANGNDGEDARYRANPSEIAALPSKTGAELLASGWLTVAALNPTEATPTLTNYSQACGIAKNYCLTAPGNVTFVAHDDNSLKWGGGTSYAAPLVSGAAALVWSAFPYFNNDLVRQTILGTATDIGAEGADEIFGYGLLNVAKAVKGPGRFDWGHVTVNLPASSTGASSVWSNEISGDSGLRKIGGGTLELTARSSYNGDTKIGYYADMDTRFDPARPDLVSALVVRQGLVNSDVDISPTGIMWGQGAFGRHVENSGLLLAGSSDSAMSIGGNFSNGDASDNPLGGSSPAILALWLGNPLNVTGKVDLNDEGKADSRLHIMGVRDGYQVSSKELLVHAGEGLTGTFGTLSWNPKLVLFDAKLEYDYQNAYLLTSRINVEQAAQAWQFDGVALQTAKRVEAVMRRIDEQLAKPLGGASSTAFINGLGAFQRAQGVDGVNRSLRSLSGQLHGVSSALTYDSIDMSRRAASERFDQLRTGGLLQTGTWYNDLSRNGSLTQAGMDGVGYSSNGEMIGHDVRIGQNAVLGLLLSRQQQQSWLPALGDQVRGRQNEGQLYAGWLRDGWYAQGRAGFGQFSREMQRHLLLGTQLDGANSRLSGHYFSLNAEAGRRFDIGQTKLTPYAGVQYVDLTNRGFHESSLSGLGLRALDWDSRRTQAYAGLRGERRWLLNNGLRLGVDARGEWQQRLNGKGEIFQASFVGMDDWQAMYGVGLAARSSLLGLGMNAAWRKHLLRLDYSRRNSPLGDVDTASLQYRRSF